MGSARCGCAQASSARAPATASKAFCSCVRKATSSGPYRITPASRSLGSTEAGKTNTFIRRSVYADQLERWFQYFDRDRVLILKAEDFSGRPKDIVQEVTSFLGLPAWESPAHTSENVGEYEAMDRSGAEWLVQKGVQLVGIDYLSIAPYGESRPTHRVLLEAGVVVVEGLDLSKVSRGRYTLHCLPLKLMGSDGAPARAILVGN